MIKRGKFYLPPPRDSRNFKELFHWLTESGVGRLVDEDGEPIGPWTPELIANAISQIDVNHRGIEVRTVQLWFQNNKKGISADNIRWLARIFGCDDPVAVDKWYKKLRDSQTRLTVERRTKRTRAETDGLKDPDISGGSNFSDYATAENKPLSLSVRSEAIFSGQHSLNLPAVVWLGFTALAFLSYVLGVESITYSPTDGLNKQVGFLWAPSWTILPIFIVPLFLSIVVELLNLWKYDERSEFVLGNSNDSWTLKVESFSFIMWAIFFVSFAIVFLLQWSGLHLRALLQGDASNYMIDWNNVALLRPDVISISEAIVFSMVAYLYFGMLMWFLFVGHLLLYTLANDFYVICGAPEFQSSEVHQRKARGFGLKIMSGTFRCTVLAILFSTCIKLQSTYLISGGESIVSWLIGDAMFVLGASDNENFWLGQRSIPQFTSLLLLALSCFVFFTCCFQIHRVLGRLCQGEGLIIQTNVSWFKMIGVVVLLAFNLVLIGEMPGFSLLLGGSVLVAIYSLYNPMFGRA